MLLSYCKQCRTAVIPFPSAEKVHLCAWNGFWQFILVSEMFASVQEINFRSIFWRKKEGLKMSWFDVSMFFRRLRPFDEKTRNCHQQVFRDRSLSNFQDQQDSCLLICFSSFSLLGRKQLEMISSWAHLVTKSQSWKPVGAEMGGKKGLTGWKWVEREVGKNYRYWCTIDTIRSQSGHYPL